MKTNLIYSNFRELDIRSYIWVPLGSFLSAIFLLITRIPSFPLYQLIHQRSIIQFISIILGGMVLAYSFLKIIRIQLEKNRTKSFISSYRISEIKDISDITKLEISGKGISYKIFSNLTEVWNESNSAESVLENLDANTESFESSMTASYLIPKLFVWAIPILGFIGTVMGIGRAVAEFDSFLGKADEIEVLKDGLVEVTKGLGTAFDTTLLALLISLITILPITLAERSEQRLLSKIDFFLRSSFLSLLPNQSSEKSANFETIKNAALQSKILEKQLKQIEGSGQMIDTFKDLKDTLKALEKTLIEASKPKKLVFMETSNDESN